MYNWSSMTSPPDLSGFDTSLVTTMVNMMRACSQDVDVSHFNVSSLTVATSMFEGSAFGNVNFDRLLASWSAQVVKPDVSFHAGTATYSRQAEYDVLTQAPNNWVITSGSQEDYEPFRFYGSDDSREASYEVRTSRAENWAIVKQPGGVYHNVDLNAVDPNVRIKVVNSSEANNANVISKTYSNGAIKESEEVVGTLDHTDTSEYSIGRYNNEITSGLYHSFQLFDQPLTAEQLEWLSIPGNNL
jgi:hypothetical protein